MNNIQPQPSSPWLKSSTLVQFIVIVAILVALFVYQWSNHNLKYTRDAYVFANNVAISSQVAGRVGQVFVKNNVYVSKGTKLFQLDQTPYLAAVARTKAALEQAKLKYSRHQQLITEAVKNKAAKLEELNELQDHLNRYKKLIATGSVAEVIFSNAKYQVFRHQQEILEAEAHINAFKSTLSENLISQAEANLLKAQWELSQTTITAPFDGQITNHYLLPGQYLNPGDIAFALIESNNWWVMARFKETLLWQLKLGQTARISIDMYPGETWNGTVESIDWGINRKQASNTAATSALPYLEPTEYWIRLAQRFPVHIRLSPQKNNQVPLRVGGNARVYIK